MGWAEIGWINALAKEVKSSEGLALEETAERDWLRREYIIVYWASPANQLENTCIVEPDGAKHKLGKES